MNPQNKTTEAEQFLLERSKDSREWARVPSHTKAALRRYLRREHAPGDFLMAVLTNDLAQAVFSADAQNIRALKPIMISVWNYMPSQCWGDKETVYSWLKGDS